MDFNIVTLTLQKVSSLVFFLLLGYGLKQWKMPDRGCASFLSVLATNVFLPAYNIQNLSQHFTRENLGTNAALFGFALILCLLVCLATRVLARVLGKSDFEKQSLSYMFAFPNMTYFGFPVIEGVFGSVALSQFQVFCLPFNLGIYLYGYALFSGESGLRAGKHVLTSPLVWSCVIGCALGLSGLSLPSLFRDILSGAGNCMSPISMLSVGMVLGEIPLKKLLVGKKPYLLSAFRLFLLSAIFSFALWVLGIRGQYFFFTAVFLSLPIGMNSVIFPESFGMDASENARSCLVSTLLSTLTLPGVFTLIAALSELNV